MKKRLNDRDVHTKAPATHDELEFGLAPNTQQRKKNHVTNSFAWKLCGRIDLSSAMCVNLMMSAIFGIRCAAGPKYMIWIWYPIAYICNTRKKETLQKKKTSDSNIFRVFIPSFASLWLLECALVSRARCVNCVIIKLKHTHIPT